MLGLLAVVFAVRSLAVFAVVLALLAWFALRFPTWWLSRVKVERSAPIRLFHGERGTVTLTLGNSGRWPLPWLTVAELVPFDLSTEPVRWVTSLGGGEARSFSYQITGRRRGLYRLGPAALVCGDPLGLHTAQTSLGHGPPVIVYPHIVSVGDLGLPATSPFPELRTRLPLHEDPLRMTGLRPYLPHDSARRIHWTASAHSGSLLVRKLQHGIGRDTVVLLDLSRDGMGSRARHIETAVTAAASILFHIITVERLAAGMRLGDVDLPPSSDHSHLMAMLEVLAVAGLHDLRQASILEAVGIPYGASLVLISRRLEGEMLDRLYGLRRQGWRPSAVLVGEETAPDIPGVPTWVIPHDRDLTGAFE